MSAVYSNYTAPDYDDSPRTALERIDNAVEQAIENFTLEAFVERFHADPCFAERVLEAAHECAIAGDDAPQHAVGNCRVLWQVCEAKIRAEIEGKALAEAGKVRLAY